VKNLLSSFILTLAVACAALSCSPKETPRKLGMASGADQTGTGVNVGLNGRNLTSNLNGTAANQVLQSLSDGGLPFFAQLTQDQIGSAFTVSLAFASGAGPFEVGQTATPTYNATPATNAGTVTGSTITDNQSCSGCPQSISSSNPLSAPSASHTYALTTPGTVTVTVAETLVSTGTTRSGSASLSFDSRGFYSATGSTSGSCTTITASGNNATTGGCSPTATLTGILATTYVGQTFSTAPVSQYVYAAFPHWTTGTGVNGSHTFKDQNGFTFNLVEVVQSYSFTNQYSQAVSMDIYVTPTPLNAPYTVTVTSWNDPRDYDWQPLRFVEPDNDHAESEAVPA
jgi:hypothetical protein